MMLHPKHLDRQGTKPPDVDQVWMAIRTKPGQGDGYRQAVNGFQGMENMGRTCGKPISTILFMI